MEEQLISSTTDKFKLFKKWFWIGIAVGFFNVVAGLIYGIALIVEKEYHKEGLIIITWSIIWALIAFFIIGPAIGQWLVGKGLLPEFQVIQ